MLRLISLAGALLAFCPLTAFAQEEPKGVLIYQQPATTYTEALEYRSFRQDNALYSTLVATTGERKQLKSGGVLAVVPYPPLDFDSYFASTAQTAIAKIESLERTYPSIHVELQRVRGKWERALSVFKQSQRLATSAVTESSSAGHALSVREGTLRDPKISAATPETVTVVHATGVATIPIAELKADQVLLLNRASNTVQLPLGIAPRALRPDSRSALTMRIESIGRAAEDWLAEKIGVSVGTFSVWAFFVVFPASVVVSLLLVARLGMPGTRRLPKAK